ncbi:hypothetical protein DERF_012714 [Dermatophagoides farinae]|uniref:Uncharacterized protein n=1 Tax=Dermatophagoides farinae TaxID=6954 RepID=A0A922L204_DERFA|nr:hypothetical protein DERF_012714 [Dermatophagoides farinae]
MSSNPPFDIGGFHATRNDAFVISFTSSGPTGAVGGPYRHLTITNRIGEPPSSFGGFHDNSMEFSPPGTQRIGCSGGPGRFNIRNSKSYLRSPAALIKCNV